MKQQFYVIVIRSRLRGTWTWVALRSSANNLISYLILFELIFVFQRLELNLQMIISLNCLLGEAKIYWQTISSQSKTPVSVRLNQTCHK